MKVYSRNIETNETEIKEVKNTFINYVDKDITKVTVKGEVIESTSKHEYYTVNRGWVDAKDLVVDVLNTGVADNINVYIGEETAKDELKNFSIVTFDHLLEDKDIGTIGIIGPTRMDYSKVIAVMKYISKKLNDDYKKGKF